MIQKLLVSLANVHCVDCEATIERTLKNYFPLAKERPTVAPVTEDDLSAHATAGDNPVFYRLDDGDLSLWQRVDSANLLKKNRSAVVNSLRKEGFIITSWALEKDGLIEVSSGTGDGEAETADAHAETRHFVARAWRRYKAKQAAKHHVENCHSCSENEKNEKLHDAESDQNASTLRDDAPPEYRAVFSVEGMSCASCVQSVSDAIASFFQERGVESKDGLQQFSVDLLRHAAVVVLPNKQLANAVIASIEDCGFSAQLVEVLPIQRTINRKVTAVIGGITCAACVNSVSSAVNALPFVLDCGINAVTKSGQFVLESSENQKQSNLDILKETVEDCGFDFGLVADEEINFVSSKSQSRSINIGVEGMFCKNCPSLIMSYLKAFGDAVVIEDPITLDQPFVRFTYVPNLEQDINVRRFLYDLNHIAPLAGSDGYEIDHEREGTFKCVLVEKVSVDDHLRRLSKRETLSIVRRLVISVVLAIPSLVFGVVGMSLLPKSHPFRLWLEDPIWAGNVSRVMWILLFLSTPCYFFAADVFHIKAVKEVKSLWVHKNSLKKRFFRFGSMNLLISLGTTVAYIASIVLLILSSRQEAMTHMGFHTTYFDSVVFLTFFLLIGRLLESFSKQKTADAVAGLSSMKASSVTIVDKAESGDSQIFGNDQTIDTRLLDSGDYIRISSGESPAVDCVIVEGETEFDESALTGESDPVKHKAGEQVFSGTVNVGSSSVIAKVLSVEGGSLIDQIVSSVRDGQMRKAPIQRTADVLTGYFVPVIVVVAILTWVIWLVLAYAGVLPAHYLDIDIGGWPVWSLEFAIAVFVIACPCGIGLAAPTALFVGSGLAAKRGILAKGGGAAFQDAAKTNLVCFDKTGTLTTGTMKVTDVAFVESGRDANVISTFALQLTRDMELSSKHPIASAIKDFTSNAKLDFEVCSNKIPSVETIPGKGLKGVPVIDEATQSIWSAYTPEEVILGNEALLADYKIELTEQQKKLLTTWKSETKTVISLGLRSAKLFGDTRFHLVSMMAVRDEIRPESKSVIEFLANKGVECWMITGDNSLTAAAIGKEIGIKAENILSEVLPSEKQAKVQKLRESPGRVVAMVGDGINDAPALATADVGVALSSGADLAVTSSDFIILSKKNPLVTLCTLFDLAQVVFRRIKFNFGWSLIYNMIGLPIAAGVIYPYNNSRLSPVWASAAMAASSVSVVTSSLLLRLYRPKVSARNLGKAVEDIAEEVRIYRI